jgi:hypothetical protein
VNILNKQPTRGGLPAWELGKELTTPHREKEKNSLLRNFTQGFGNYQLLKKDSAPWS